jgi:cell division protein FtsQ
MLRKILTILINFSLVIVLLGSMAFVKIRNNNRKISDLKVEIIDYDHRKFIDSTFVISKIESIYDSLYHLKPDNVDLVQLEGEIVKISSVGKVDAFFDVNNVINISIDQRDPIARVFHKNKSFYIDSSSETMPVQSNYSSEVVVVFVKEEAKFDKDDIFNVLQGINSYEFFKKQIVAINVLENGKLNFETQKGGHIIEFGRAENIEDKLKKLFNYYKHTVSEFGWDTYKKINLEFANQVVCTK